MLKMAGSLKNLGDMVIGQWLAKGLVTGDSATTVSNTMTLSTLARFGEGSGARVSVPGVSVPEVSGSSWDFFLFVRGLLL
jgi:hypothetical protein